VALIGSTSSHEDLTISNSDDSFDEMDDVVEVQRSSSNQVKPLFPHFIPS
jgi:hypothetical protein